MSEFKEKKEVAYRSFWKNKTKKQIQSEIKSFQRFFEKNYRSYEWHGKYQQHPDELADGDRVRILKDIIRGE